MKRFILFIICIISAVNIFSQSKQDGFVKEYNERTKKKPLPGVQVLVANANHDVTGKEGDFHLQFRTLKPGDLVKVQNIIKSGYEIFNKEQLEVWRIAHNNTPFTIVMCKSSMLRTLKDEYNAIAYKSYEEQRSKELKLWENQLKQGKVKLAEYEKQIAALCDYYDRKLDNLDTYIDRFAHIDMSEVTREERRIVELVRKGMIQEAIDEYNALKLDEELIKNYQEYQKADAAIKSLTKVSEKKHAYEEELLSSLNNKFNLMMMQGSREAIDHILSEYENLAAKCPHSLNILRSFVDFANKEKDYARVAKWGRILIELIPDDTPLMKERYCRLIGSAEGYLGNEDSRHLYAERATEWLTIAMEKDPSSAVYSYVVSELNATDELIQNENGLAKSMDKSEKLLNFLDSLYSANPTNEMRHTYLTGKHELYANLGEIHIRLNDIAKVIEYNDKSILYLDSLQMIDNSDFVKSLKANAYNNSAYYNLYIRKFNEAETLLMKAKELTEEVYNIDPYKYYSDRLVNYTYTGMLYYFTGQMDKALSTYKEAVKFAGEIVESRPYPMYFTSYAELINNLGFVSFTLGYDKEAEAAFLACIEKAKPFAEKNPFKHLSALSVAQINLGTLMLKQGRLEEFKAMQEAYWDNTEKVHRWIGTTFNVSHAVAWDNKGYYALLKGDTVSALSAWKEIQSLEPNYLINNPISLLYNGLKERGLIDQ